MSYADIAALAGDPDFALRTVAAYSTETLGSDRDVSPPDWQQEHAWDMAAQPGFGDAYASALAGDVDRPGLDQSVISDEQILSAIQTLVPSGE